MMKRACFPRASLVAALTLALAAALLFTASARADMTIFSPATTLVLSTDWTDLGAGPADVQNLSVQHVYIATAASKPSAGVLGSVLKATRGKASYNVTTHLWARSVQSGTLPVVAVTSYAGTPVGGAQKITTTATISSGQTVSGATDLGTARFWAMTTPATLSATAVTFLANAE